MADEDIFDVEGLAKGLIKGLDTPKDYLVDFPLGVVQAGNNIARGDVPLPKSFSDVFDPDSPFYEGLTKDSLPNVPGFEETIQFMGDLEDSGGNLEEGVGMITSTLGSSVALVKVLDQIKAKNPKLFKFLRKAYPFSVGQFYVAMKAQPDGPGKIKKVLNALKGTLPQGYKGDKTGKTVLKKVLPRLLGLSGIGGALSAFMTKPLNEGEDEEMAVINEFFTMDEEGNLVPKPSAP